MIEPAAACTQYTSTDNLVLKNMDNELSFVHVNIMSLSKYKSLLEQLMVFLNNYT